MASPLICPRPPLFRFTHFASSVGRDVHHGDGTQALLLREPRALYVSLHRYGSVSNPPSSPPSPTPH